MRHCWGTMTMPHTRYGHDQDRSRNMRTRNRRLGPLVQHPPPLPLGGITPQQAENQHTTTRKEAASTSLHKTRDLTHPLRGIAPVTSRCTRYVAIHPLRGAAPVTSRCTRYVALHPNRRGAMPTDRVQCLHIGCNAYTSGARPPVTSSDADLPEWRSTDPTGLAAPGGGAPPTTNSARRRSPNSWLGPAAQSKQLAGPGDGRAWRGFETTHRAGGSRRRQRAGHRARGSRRCAASSPGASLPRRQGPGRGAHMHQARARRSRGVEARARGTHATSPGTTRAYDEAGTRRAKQRGGPRPRQQVRPGDPP